MAKRSIADSTETEAVGEITVDCLLTRTRKIARVITSIYDKSLRSHGVNAPQFSLLVLISRLRGASRAEIGRANYQERSTLTRNLALLLSEGWIDEIPTKEGSRRQQIVISRAGRELLLSALPSWRSAQASAKRILGSEGVAAIVEVADGIPPYEAD